jgi:uncharacterized YigZ family protein
MTERHGALSDPSSQMNDRTAVTERFSRTIASNASTELDVRRSRFIGHCFRVQDEGEARSEIERVKKLFWDANHNCSAWRIGRDGQSQRTSDDGEPAGTAGMPMLEVLRHRDLTDILIVVTRYFGGIKLGAGGLIRAYGSATSAVLDEAGVVERRPMHRMVAMVDHGTAGRFENQLRTTDFDLADVDYTGSGVEFAVHLDAGTIPVFEAWVAENTAGAGEVVDMGTFEVEVPVDPSTE